MPFPFPSLSRLRSRVAFARCLLVAWLAAAAALAQAQVLDRIDVVPRATDAEIVIRFSGRTLYLRHVPQDEGRQVRVFLRQIGERQPESDPLQESVRSPRTPGVPDVVVRYPEVGDAMLVTFSRTTAFAVRPGEDGRSIVITVPLADDATRAPAAAPAVAPAEAPAKAPAEPRASEAGGSSPDAAAAPAVPVPPEVVEANAARYFTEAQAGMAARDPALAINRLNRVLGMPRNARTEAAQALIGEARELNGEPVKARAEYELYLKLFPEGPAASRVAQRLAALPKGDAAVAAARARRPLPAEAGQAEWTAFGSVSSYYYTGKSQVETLTPPPPGQLNFNREVLSAVDQQSLITSLNLNARRRDAHSDTRIVFRATDNDNHLRPDRSYRRIYSAYVDHTDRRLGYYVRAGRQNPSGIGVLERFDGVQAGYNLGDDWRVNGVFGAAVEFGSPFDKVFHGASVDFLPVLGRPGVSMYAIEQSLDGHANRRAVGTELRYFDGRNTAYGMLDYDVLYGGVNIALLQGNHLDEDGNNYFFVVDHRRAPSYSLTNALPGGMGMSLADMIATQGIDVVRRQASLLTATSNMLSIGLTRRVSPEWQLGVDYRMSEITSTAPVNAVIPLSVIGVCLGVVDTLNNNCILSTASQQGSGRNHAVNFQAIGSNLWREGAVGVSNLTFIFAPTFAGQALALSYVLPMGAQWRLDANLRYYRQRDDAGGSQSRISPSLRLAWKWLETVYVEGEIGRELWRTHSVDRQDRISRGYLYAGLRWDLR